MREIQELSYQPFLSILFILLYETQAAADLRKSDDVIGKDGHIYPKDSTVLIHVL